MTRLSIRNSEEVIGSTIEFYYYDIEAIYIKRTKHHATVTKIFYNPSNERYSKLFYLEDEIEKYVFLGDVIRLTKKEEK